MSKIPGEQQRRGRDKWIKTHTQTEASYGSMTSTRCLYRPRLTGYERIPNVVSRAANSQWPRTVIAMPRTVWVKPHSHVRLRPPVFEKTCVTLKNRKKSHAEPHREKRTFRGHLITPVLIRNYRKSVPISQQHQTSLLRNADVVFTFTRNYAT